MVKPIDSKRDIQSQEKSYVKPIDGKAFYRVELALAPNQPIEISLGQIRTHIILDENILKSWNSNK